MIRLEVRDYNGRSTRNTFLMRDMQRITNGVSVLGQRQRRWPSTETPFVLHLYLVWIIASIPDSSKQLCAIPESQDHDQHHFRCLSEGVR